MRKVLLGVVLCGLLASGANGALLFLQADDGSAGFDLAPGDSDNMSIMLTIRAIDPGFAFANVFLDDDDQEANGQVDVTGLIDGIGTFYDDSSYDIPMDISHNQQNEYALIMGSGPAEGENWGPGTYLLQTLVLTHNGDREEGRVDITFEKGARMPGITTASPDFQLYVWGLGFDDVLPGFSDPGVGGSENPFNINYIPEPASLALVAFGGLALLRRRR